jgi:MFS family permease
MCAAALAVAQAAVAAAHSMVPLVMAVFAYGVSAGAFSVAVIGTLQTHTAEEMRGRVMAWYSLCFLGSSPVGGPAFGVLAGWLGVSGALRVEACVCAAVALATAIGWRVMRPRQKADVRQSSWLG